MKRACSISFVAAALVIALLAQDRLFAQANAADALIGTWVLDRAKSTYSGQPPERRTMKFDKTPKGIQHTTESLQGEVLVKTTYTFQVDGKDYVADVSMPVSTVSFKRVDASTLERSGKYMGDLIETVVYKVSADGKTLTTTQNARIQGTEITSNQVFNKQ